MIVKNLSAILILSSALVLSTSVMAMEDSEIPDGSPFSRPFPSTAVTDRESEALLFLQASVKKGTSQHFINDTFVVIACRGYLTAVKWILSQECTIKPDQESMNWGLRGAARYCANTMVHFLLSQPDGKLKPDQKTIDTAYEKVSDDFGYIAPEDPRHDSMDRMIAVLRSFATKKV